MTCGIVSLLALTYALPGRDFPLQLLKGWQVNAIVTLQSPQPWTVNDTGNNISSTNENTDRWDFFGSPSNFQSTDHSIPYCTSGAAGGCTELLANGSTFMFSQAQSTTFYNACSAAAAAVDGGSTTGPTTASLATFGCFAQGHSVMIPPAAGTFGTMGRNLFRDSGFRDLDMSIVEELEVRRAAYCAISCRVFQRSESPELCQSIRRNERLRSGEFRRSVGAGPTGLRLRHT